MQQTRLTRIVNFVDRKRLRNFYDRWVKGTQRICDLDSALLKSARTCYKNKLRNNFNKWKRQARAKQRAENILSRGAWLNDVRKRASIRDIYNELKLYAKRRLTAKRFLHRAINGVERNALMDAYAKWKTAFANQVQTMHMEEISNLKGRQE